MKKFISNEEILKNALRTEDDVVDEDLKKFLEESGMTIQEIDLSIFIGAMTGDFSSLEEKLNKLGLTMKEEKRMKDNYQINLEEKMKLNLFMSIYNTDELIGLIKEYQAKFGCDGDINTDMMHKFMMIKELQKETFDMMKEERGNENNN